ncbi:hypothetical protein U9M48_028211 [Paspalum notatum var. saurae]|uniref:Uncharacterized protein n=1 Tax=Paspalum notatum var. saurae TaxID=547442 RepID=A0AAQ3X034_PASNO
MSTVAETTGPKNGKKILIEEEEDLVSIDLSSSSEKEESENEAQKEMKKMAKEMAKKTLKKMTKKLMAQVEKKMEKKSESTSSPKKIKSSGVNIPKKDELITLEMMQDLHRNAQAVCILNNGLSEEERRKVKGMEIAKEIWDKLQLAHEGDRKAKLGKIELIQGELDNFVLLKGETLQELFDRFMELINKIRALGSEEWDDENKVARRFLRAYQVKNMTLATIIRERDDFEAMDAHTLLGKLQHHEMTDQAAIAAAGRIPNAIMPNESENKGVALQATNEDEASK